MTHSDDDGLVLPPRLAPDARRAAADLSQRRGTSRRCSPTAASSKQELEGAALRRRPRARDPRRPRPARRREELAPRQARRAAPAGDRPARHRRPTASSSPAATSRPARRKACRGPSSSPPSASCSTRCSRTCFSGRWTSARRTRARSTTAASSKPSSRPRTPTSPRSTAASRMCHFADDPAATQALGGPQGHRPLHSRRRRRRARQVPHHRPPRPAPRGGGQGVLSKPSNTPIPMREVRENHNWANNPGRKSQFIRSRCVVKIDVKVLPGMLNILA